MKPTEEEAREIARSLEEQDIYRGLQGKKRLTDMLPGGVQLRDIVPRLIVLVGRPYAERIERLQKKDRASTAEKRALSRKAHLRPDVVVWDDLTLAEVASIVHMRNEHVSVARIATIFEIPTATVKTILDVMSGKAEGSVLHSAELRRRRRAKADEERRESEMLYGPEEEPEAVTVRLRSVD